MSMRHPNPFRAILLAPLALAIACGPSGSAGGSGPDPFEDESRGGKLHTVDVENFDVTSFVRGSIPSDASIDALFTATAGDTAKALRGLSARDFNVVSSATETTPAGIRLAHVRLQQKVNDVPVWGAYVSMTAKAADVRGGAKLLASSHHVYSGVKAGSEPELSLETAAGLARVANRMTGSPIVADSQLVLWPIKGGLDLVWSVKFQDSYYRALVYASGDLKGRVRRVDERYYQSSGTFTGEVINGGAPGGTSGTVATSPIPNANISNTVDGAVLGTTDANGQFVVDVAEGTIISAALAGIAVTATADQTGLATSVEAPAAPVTDFNIGEAGNVLAIANNTAYFFTDQTLAFLQDNGVTDAALNNLTVNTNIDDSCNAFFTGTTINFFQGDAQCHNTAEATIVMHEYGHFVDAVFGGITNGGLSEGWGDLLACLITKQPGLGIEFFVNDDSPLRTCDNDYQFPPNGNDQVHNLGQAWAGFGFHARQGLIDELGEVEGDALARALILPSFPSNAADIPAAVREVFIRDDDDGDLGNLTPHWDILLAAAELHSLGFVIDQDLIAPADTTDLEVATATSTSAELTWTAPADDGDSGDPADSYDIRRSSELITPTNFAQATPIAGPVPLAPGSTQTATVGLVPGETVFFALRTFDEQNNGSGISNVVEITADAGNVVFEDSFEDGAEGWAGTGLWHITTRKASDGANAFWYGDEATGNYDTGAANAGTLISPPIDLNGAGNAVLVFATEFDVEAGSAFDRMIITAFDDADPTVSVSVEELEGFSNGFQSRVLALDGLTDRTVRLSFSFDTGDEQFNDTEGWFIDHVRIISDMAVAPPSLIINEVMADPGSFDSNNDGKLSFRDDEFVELLNIGETDLDLTGVTLADNKRVRFTFPDGTIVAAGQSAVVFGGGIPNIGSLAFSAGNLALNNSSDTITIRAADGAELAAMTYGAEAGNNQSVTRQVDGDHEAPFVVHTSVSSSVASPGARTDGTPFGEVEPGGAVLMINEVLSDPGALIDANGDGVFSTTEDEFVEIVNIGDADIDLSGATLSDLVAERLTIPDGTVVAAGGALVIFGGGAAAIDGVTTVIGPGQLFLNNGGDTVTLTSAGGEILCGVAFGNSNDHSLNRSTDLSPNAEMVNHGTLTQGLASPGRRVDGSEF